MKKILFGFLCLVCLNAKSLVVLEPAAAEILLALGAKDNILGVSKPSMLDIYPTKLSSKLESVGTYIRPSIEKIVSLKPDLVIVGDYSNNIQNDLKNFNLDVLVLKSSSISDIKSNIKILSKLVNRQSEGENLVLSIDKKIENIKKDSFYGKKILFISLSNPLMAYCSSNLVDDLSKAIGFDNLCNKKEPSLIINTEYILSQNPDYIVYMGNDTSFVENNQFLKLTKAYKNSNIVFFQSSRLLRASHRVVDELQDLANKLNKSKEI